MDRNSMTERLTARRVASITVALKNGDAEELVDLINNWIGYDFKTLREIIDEYNSIKWEEV